jgi:hypothetical protein
VQVLDTREHLTGERQTYQELFEFAPAGYLLTTPMESFVEPIGQRHGFLRRWRTVWSAGR